jgi:hypothetical protein
LKRICLIFLMASLFSACGPAGETNSPEVVVASQGFELTSGDTVLVVRAQTPDEAYAYVSSLLRDMEFFRANGYNVTLPTHAEFRADASPRGTAKTFKSQVYSASDFERGIKSLQANRKALQQVLDWFVQAPDAKGIRRYARYEIILTLYGPGGMYDAHSGAITLQTTVSGFFKGEGGVPTLFHEMLHLAVEEGIVQHFGLSHWEKERLVDLLSQTAFDSLRLSYRMQPQGVAALNSFLAGVPLVKISEAVARYLSESRKEK